MFVAGNLDSDAELIENLVTIMEAARLGACVTREPAAPSIRLGGVAFRGPGIPAQARELDA